MFNPQSFMAQSKIWTQKADFFHNHCEINTKIEKEIFGLINLQTHISLLVDLYMLKDCLAFWAYSFWTECSAEPKVRTQLKQSNNIASVQTNKWQNYEMTLPYFTENKNSLIAKNESLDVKN